MPPSFLTWRDDFALICFPGAQQPEPLGGGVSEPPSLAAFAARPPKHPNEDRSAHAAPYRHAAGERWVPFVFVFNSRLTEAGEQMLADYGWETYWIPVRCPHCDDARMGGGCSHHISLFHLW